MKHTHKHVRILTTVGILLVIGVVFASCDTPKKEKDNSITFAIKGGTVTPTMAKTGGADEKQTYYVVAKGAKNFTLTATPTAGTVTYAITDVAGKATTTPATIHKTTGLVTQKVVDSFYYIVATAKKDGYKDATAKALVMQGTEVPVPADALKTLTLTNGSATADKVVLNKATRVLTLDWETGRKFTVTAKDVDYTKFPPEAPKYVPGTLTYAVVADTTSVGADKLVNTVSTVGLVTQGSAKTATNDIVVNVTTAKVAPYAALDQKLYTIKKK